MKKVLEIFRFDPEKDREPHYDRFEVDAEPMDRILDLLNYIKENIDGTLTYRRSCAHGVCGSDAMEIDGLNRLACQVLVKDLKKNVIKISPLRGFKVLKDLYVDFDPFFRRYAAIKPYLVGHEPAPQKERLQSEEDRQKIDDTTKCILCGCCTSSCPSFWYNPEYLGPQAFVAAHRFVMDSRDHGNEERLKVLNDRNALWRCHTIFNCTDCCPREINITQAISELKRETLRFYL